jgi:site-specific recombinase XerD
VFHLPARANVDAALKRIAKKVGIDKNISFHTFRHTFATLQLAAGTDLYTISKMLTHSNISTTQIYADVVNDLKRKAADTISLKSNNTQNND